MIVFEKILYNLCESHRTLSIVHLQKLFIDYTNHPKCHEIRVKKYVCYFIFSMIV